MSEVTGGGDPLPPQLSEEEARVKALVLEGLRTRVFNEELLLEKIVDFAICCEGEHGSEEAVALTSELQVIRLVSKSWLVAVTKCLRKRRMPLFYWEIKLGEEFHENPNRKIGLLDSFQKSLTTRIEGRHPPIKINISNRSFFHRKNHKTFLKLLSGAGENLVELELTLPRDGGSMTFILKGVSLPLLRKFKANLSIKSGGSAFLDNDWPELNHFGNANNLNYLMQAVISASRNLSEIQFPYQQYMNLVPHGFECLILPDTITKLDFSVPMNCRNLEILQENELPGLKHLELQIADQGFDGGCLTKIFNKFRKSLETFSMDGIGYLSNNEAGGRNAPGFELPLMEKLRKLELATPYYGELGENPKLERNLPKLEHLVLMGHTVAMFQKWVDNRKFQAVTKFHVSLSSFAETGSLEPVHFTEELMAKVSSAFPNLTRLDISLSCRELGGIRYIFRKMWKLETLRILLQRGTEEISGSDEWDCLLSGLSLEDIARWRENPEDFTQEEPAAEENSSITNLSELRYLSLMSADTAPDLSPLISNAAFQLALLEMPNLSGLDFRGRFVISPEMIRRCEELGKDVLSIPWEHVVMPLESEGEYDEEDEDEEVEVGEDANAG